MLETISLPRTFYDQVDNNGWQMVHTLINTEGKPFEFDLLEEWEKKTRFDMFVR